MTLDFILHFKVKLSKNMLLKIHKFSQFFTYLLIHLKITTIKKITFYFYETTLFNEKFLICKNFYKFFI